MHMEEELLRKILEKLESMSISNIFNKPLIAISPENSVKMDEMLGRIKSF